MGFDNSKNHHFKPRVFCVGMKHRMVGYGSLLSHNSLSKTIPDRKLTPVMVKGYKRVFNLVIPGKKTVDVLNLEKSGRHTFNGILFDVNETELRKIAEREDDYNLEETTAYDFYSNKKIGTCLVCIDYLVSLDRKKRKPDMHYFIQCREAAYHLGQEFGKKWDATTYLSNGQKVREWIKANPSYDSLFQL